ncbi:DNA (cytosine-5)-methyltransferase 1 [Rhizobium sp. PP-F2F-G20b]|nr:DNA (cytosine-5)-methyltransferase 1 [Rhizobium sp. PP-F2F-G20b]
MTRNKSARRSGPLAISLFSGAMGLDLGFEAAGYEVVFAADNMRAACETIRKNRPQLPVFDGDVRTLSSSIIRDQAQVGTAEIDVLIGGPPCQAFSTAGKRLGPDKDDRAPLVFEFARLVDEIRPRFFVMENVKGLLSASNRHRVLPYNNNGAIIDDLHGSLLRDLSSRFYEIGYSITINELNAADFGVAQSRRRVFVCGTRVGHLVPRPTETHGEHGGLLNKPWRTLRDAIWQLRDKDFPGVQFSARKKEVLSLIPPGSNWRSLPIELQQESMGAAFYAKGGRSGYWRRLSWDKPSPTLLTEPNNASTSLCHPDKVRPLNIEEYKAIQGFPPDFELLGSIREQYTLLGNAVPVGLARAVAQTISLASETRLGDPCLSSRKASGNLSSHRLHRNEPVLAQSDFFPA